MASNATPRSAYLDLLPVNLIGQAPSFVRVLETVRRIADYDVTVSIFGETGTGKELIAGALHYASARADGPFVPVNCGAIPDSLFESELFGHRRGAFTDAREDRVGLVQQADRGTLFLDEIEALTPKGQVTLLRFLQNREFRRVGGSKLRKAHVRVVVASNIDLEALRRKSDQFREDLYYRLQVIPLRLPSLAERQEDIPLLARHFLDIFKVRYGLSEKYLGESTLRWLSRRDWSGNIRELKNLIHRGVLLSMDREILPEHIDLDGERSTGGEADMTYLDAKAHALERFEESYLRTVMSRCNGNVTQAAEYANMGRRTLGRLLKKHQLNRQQFSVDSNR